MTLVSNSEHFVFWFAAQCRKQTHCAGLYAQHHSNWVPMEDWEC